MLEAGKTTTKSRFENELKRAVYKKWLATDSFTYFSFIEKIANKGLKVVEKKSNVAIMLSCFIS